MSAPEELLGLSMFLEPGIVTGTPLLDRILALIETEGLTVDDWQLELLQQAFPTGPPPVAARELRPLPGRATFCPRCRSRIVWAITAARDTGPGGKAMPLDPIEHPEGNVAVSPGHGGRLVARVLKKDEQPVVPVEYQAMPHFATCGKSK